MSPFIPSPLFPSPDLQRHKLNQLNGHALEAQFWFTVSPTELNRSALVTSLLTLSFSLMWTQEGWLHRGCGAYPGSGEAALDTCSKRYDLGQGWRVIDSYSLHSFPLFSPTDVQHFVRFAALWIIYPWLFWTLWPASFDAADPSTLLLDLVSF